jgi:hypothetical protein
MAPCVRRVEVVAGFWIALREGGPWSVVLLITVAFAFAIVRGHIVRGSELDRQERRFEKDTDRVLSLYVKQIETLVEAAKKKDETIASQDKQIEKLIVANEVSATALEKIVKEAQKRGFFE